MSFFSIENQYIYDLISSFYGDILLQKIRNENDQVSLYGARLPSLLLNEKRYMFVQCPSSDLFQRKLKDTPWITLQLRTLENDDGFHNLPMNTYSVKREQKYFLPLQVASRDKQITVYKCPQAPIQVSLLHTKGIEYEYPNDGNLVSALETYQTIIQFAT